MVGSSGCLASALYTIQVSARNPPNDRFIIFFIPLFLVWWRRWTRLCRFASRCCQYRFLRLLTDAPLAVFYRLWRLHLAVSRAYVQAMNVDSDSIMAAYNLVRMHETSTVMYLRLVYGWCPGQHDPWSTSPPPPKGWFLPWWRRQFTTPNFYRKRYDDTAFLYAMVVVLFRRCDCIWLWWKSCIFRPIIVATDYNSLII